MARAHSDDATSASKGGQIDWLNPGDVPPSFQDVVDSIAIGQLSEPFRSPYGWHIVEVLERRDQDQTDVVAASQAREAIRDRKVREEEELWMRRLRAEAYIEYRDPQLAPDAAS